MKALRSKNIITPNGIFDGYVLIKNGTIFGVVKNVKKSECEKIIDYSGDYILPGFIEIHTHGGGGFPFINNTVEDVKNACDFHLKHGTTSIMPTVTAACIKTMEKAIENIKKCKEQKLTKSNILGAHLEGPYLSKEQAGAQCSTFIKSPNKKEYTRLIKKYKPFISRWTYAPENDTGCAFAKYLLRNNIKGSIGHSNAIKEVVDVAFKNGSNLITHLYSCTSTIVRDHGFRKLGIIETAYLNKNMYVEIICDGKHLPEDLIKLIIQNKSINHIIACSDSLEIAGTSIKAGLMSGTPFIVEDGVCKLKDRSAFAGSITTGDKMLEFLNLKCGIKIEDCVKLLSSNAATLFKLKTGKIEKGFDADLNIICPNLKIKETFVKGHRI